MSLTLTQLASDNFQRANVTPLAAPWALDEFGDAGLQIVSDVCEPSTSDLNWHIQLYNYAGGTPNDQYASMTLGNTDPSFQAGLAVRYTDNGTRFPASGYLLQVGNAGSQSWSLSSQDGTLASGADTFAAGDVWTLAAVGDTIFVLKNGVQLASVMDTTHASGQTALGAYPVSVSGVQITAFSMGSAALTSNGGNGGDPPDPPSGSDGTQVKVIASGSQYGAPGSVVVLSTQVALQQIAAGAVEAFGTAPPDGQQVQIVEPGQGFNVGDTPTLAYQKAQDFIARGIAIAL